MNRDHLLLRFGLAPLLPLIAATAAVAASSITNSFTGFTGTSASPATQAALAAAGFEVSDLVEPAAMFSFGANGVTFGNGQQVNVGRNYLRTIDDDFANRSFVAEISMVASDILENNGYFGLGAGDTSGSFRIPDYQTQFSTVMYFGENDPAAPVVQTMINDNTRADFASKEAPGQGNGTHRIRLAYEWFAKTATVSVDINYAGGPFIADVTADPVNTLKLYGVDGFANEPGRIYFGGDRDVVFKDFSVQISGPNLLMGDFDTSGSISPADWAILRANQHVDLSSKTLEEAFKLGDLNLDKKNNHEDFVLFKLYYEDANGSGSFTQMLAGVPEPTSIALIMLAGFAGIPLRLRR